jgi:CheY-like chemotaxis protein
VPSRVPAILIVDDDSDDEYILRRRLAKTGVPNPIHSFADGCHAVEFLAQLSPDQGPSPWLMLLDLKMPQLDGFDTLRWLRSHPAWNALKVIVITGSTTRADVERAVECGAHQVLVKFPTVPELQDALAKCA